MARAARARLVSSVTVALLAGAFGGACGSSPPTDRNLGTDLGADFRAPHVDAGSDTNLTPEGGPGGAAGDAGAGAAGSSGAAGSPGAAGAGGAAGGAGAVQDAGGVEAGG
jgi:pilus assembly protein FimV